jgi:hypothetical protein
MHFQCVSISVAPTVVVVACLCHPARASATLPQKKEKNFGTHSSLVNEVVLDMI